MERYLLIVIALTVSALSYGQPVRSETPEQKAARMEWFSNAKLGIFIHWGIYSRGDWSESWSFYNKRVSLEDYFAQKKDFTAEKYDPKEWVSLIRERGAKYTVITTKHYDGVALWDTKAGDVSTVKSCAAGRDVLTPFVDEVRRQGGLKTHIKKVRVVGTDRTLDWNLYNDIDWSEVPGVYYINVPEDILDEHITVLALELEGPLNLYRGSGQVMSFNNY